MASLRSIRMGMSKSYQSLNTLGNDNDNAQVHRNQNGIETASEWLGVDNFQTERNRNNPLDVIKSAMSMVSRSGKYRTRTSKSSQGLRELDENWKITEEEDNSNIMGKLRNSQYSKMHSTMVVSAEQASPLLGSFPSEGLDDIELRNVQLTLASSKSLSDDGTTGSKETVETRHGPITIAIAGDRSKPVILTYHDLGLNHVTNFQNFMAFPEMTQLQGSFCIVHVNAPGQEHGSRTLPEDYVYPTMEELAETIINVKGHLGFRTFIGFGIGLGANVLSRYALKYPEEVDALVLINCSATQAGWIEWGYQKVNIRHLKAGRMTVGTVDYLMWHHFGKLEACNQDLVTVYKQHFDKNLNATNLGFLVDAYIRRTDLGIVRELDPNKKKDVKMIRCPILNVTSNFSPHVEDTVTFNSRLDPSLCTWMKIQDCGMVLDEFPGKVVEAFRLFLQGQGYAVGGSRRSSAVSVGEVVNSRSLGSRQGSVTTLQSFSPLTLSNGSMAVNKDIRITENPLQNPAV